MKKRIIELMNTELNLNKQEIVVLYHFLSEKYEDLNPELQTLLNKIERNMFSNYSISDIQKSQ